MTGKKNFGFTIQAGRQIDLDQADTSFSDNLAGLVSAWSACLNCGSCSATCPAGINLRDFYYHLRASSSLTDHYQSQQSCFLCGKCQLVCPRGIPTRYLSILIMQKLKPHAEGISSI